MPANKKLKPQNEQTGTSLGPKDMGLKAKWAGSNPGPDTIAAVSKDDRKSQGATRKSWAPAMSKRMDPGTPTPRMGYGGYGCR